MMNQKKEDQLQGDWSSVELSSRIFYFHVQCAPWTHEMQVV